MGNYIFIFPKGFIDHNSPRRIMPHTNIIHYNKITLNNNKILTLFSSPFLRNINTGNVDIRIKRLYITVVNSDREFINGIIYRSTLSEFTSSPWT